MVKPTPEGNQLKLTELEGRMNTYEAKTEGHLKSFTETASRIEKDNKASIKKNDEVISVLHEKVNENAKKVSWTSGAVAVGMWGVGIIIAVITIVIAFRGAD